MKSKFLAWLFLMMVIALNGQQGQAQSGGGYDLTWHTMDGGGGLSSGGDYSLNSTIGQLDAATMNGGDYRFQGGFWSGDCAPPGIVDPSISLAGIDVQLSWLAANGADRYDIYRDTTPHFEAATVYDNTTSSSWLDPGAADNLAENYFYSIRAIGCGESGEGRRVGAFRFDITPRSEG